LFDLENLATKRRKLQRMYSNEGTGIAEMDEISPQAFLLKEESEI
jgi:hypothetical protein